MNDFRKNPEDIEKFPITSFDLKPPGVSILPYEKDFIDIKNHDDKVYNLSFSKCFVSEEGRGQKQCTFIIQQCTFIIRKKDGRVPRDKINAFYTYDFDKAMKVNILFRIFSKNSVFKINNNCSEVRLYEFSWYSWCWRR